MQKISKWILKISGWKMVIPETEPPKSIICVAPHTTNWDFVVGKLYYWAAGREAGFLMKKSWFFFPFGNFFRAMGGVPIDRSKRSSVTQQMVDMFNSRDTFHLAITPEGTRSLVTQWKMGFYYIALSAGVPIQLAYIDYKKKEMGITKMIIPTGNEEADMQIIKDFYKNITPRYPEKFSV